MIFIATDKITAYDNWLADENELLDRQSSAKIVEKIENSIKNNTPYVDLRGELDLNSQNFVVSMNSSGVNQKNESEVTYFFIEDKIISSTNWSIQYGILAINSLSFTLKTKDFSEIADFVKKELDAHRSYIDFRKL